MYKAYTYRLYPNKTQAVLINKTIGCARLIYNLLLGDKIQWYKEYKEMLKREVTYYKGMKEYEFLKEVDFMALANAKLHLETAYKNFFSGRAGFPKFKKKGIHDTYTTNQISNNVRITDGKIRLPKIGYVKTKHKRFPADDESIKSVTVSKKAGRYYASVLVEYEYDIPAGDVDGISLSDCIGLDYSSPSFYIDSNGNTAGYPKYYRKSEAKLSKLQHDLSRKQKGSARYSRQKLKVQRMHQHIANQRKDFAHKKSRELVDKYKLICFEDLNLSALKKSLHLGKSTSDNGFGMFRTFCEYKAGLKGNFVIKVDRFFASSQTCSNCGYKNPEVKNLSVREWVCPECGMVHDRDVNAAVNIRDEGFKILKHSYALA